MTMIAEVCYLTGEIEKLHNKIKKDTSTEGTNDSIGKENKDYAKVRKGVTEGKK